MSDRAIEPGGADVGSVDRSRLARALLPALLHDIANTTQRLVGVRALLDFEDPTLAAPAGADLLWAGERAHEQGWLMGLVALALDVDLLLERRWAAGLGATLALVGAALARDGERCAVQRAEVPLLAGRLSARVEAHLCLALAEIVFDAGRSAPSARVELLFERSEQRVALRGSRGAQAAGAAHARLRDALLQAAEFERDGDAWLVRMPGEWFERPAPLQAQG